MPDWPERKILKFEPLIDWSAMDMLGGKEPALLIAICDDGKYQIYHGKGVELEKIGQNLDLGDPETLPFEINHLKSTPVGNLFKLKDGGTIWWPWGCGGWPCCWVIKPTYE